MQSTPKPWVKNKPEPSPAESQTSSAEGTAEAHLLVEMFCGT